MGDPVAMLDDLDFGMLEMLDVADIAAATAEPPPIGDASWEARSRDLMAFLCGGPRSWDELERWAAGRRLGHDEIRCQLVVLEDAKKATVTGRGLNLRWVSKAKTGTRRRRAA
jgi:hypothetical protein